MGFFFASWLWMCVFCWACIKIFLGNGDVGVDTVHASGCPAARQAPKETGVGMQVTYMHSKMKGACAMSAGLVVSLQRRSLNEDALANMTAW